MHDTGTPISNPTDHARWERERERALRGEAKFYGDRVTPRDSRLTSIIAWLAGVLGVLFTGSAIWFASTLVSLDRNVSIIMARPTSVNKEQYESDMKQMKEDLSEAKRDISEIRLKQAETLRKAP